MSPSSLGCQVLCLCVMALAACPDSDATHDTDAVDSDQDPLAGVPEPSATLREMAAHFSEVCNPDYAGNSDAPAFDPREDGPHFMLFLNENGSAHRLNALIPPELRPKRVADVQLIVCTGDVGLVFDEQCRGPIPFGPERFHRALSGRVISVQSGAFDRFEVSGGLAPTCPFAPLPDAEDQIGGYPTLEEIKSDTVDRYVRLPDCDGGRPLAACWRCFRDQQELGIYPSCTSSSAGIAGTPRDPISARPDQRVTLDSMDPLQQRSLYSVVLEVDWSASPDAKLLETLDGPQVIAKAREAGVYHFIADTGFDDHGVRRNTQRQEITLDCRDAPVVEKLEVPEYARAGLSSSAVVHMSTRPRSMAARMHETFNWSWERLPKSSHADLPGGSQDGENWLWKPDVVGEYQLRLAYDDGLGPSDEVVSTIVKVGSAPRVKPPANAVGSTGTPTLLNLEVTEATGTLHSEWRLISKPAESKLDVSNTSMFMMLGTQGVLYADAPGEYTFEAVVTDELGRSDPLLVKVTIV